MRRLDSMPTAVVLDLPGSMPVVRSDVTRVRQVLGNLFSNAGKYTDEGEVRAHVELRSELRERT